MQIAPGPGRISESVTKAARAHAAEEQHGGGSAALFDKAATIDDIHSIQAGISRSSKENDRVVVESTTSVKSTWPAPAWLVMRYSGSSR